MISQLNEGQVSRKVYVAVEKMDESIQDAIEQAKASEVPQGLIAGLLHAIALQETQEIIS